MIDIPFRIGHGYDVHRLISDRKLVIGGVDIPFDKGLLGHSDADVLLHAIMDAVIGALGLGDIGRHFPDTDIKFKNIDSKILTRKVYVLMATHGYIIGNIDCTIIAQKPKLSPYIEQMKNNIADLFNVTDDKTNKINIKATTEEGLGFTGSGDGISAHAVVLITKINHQGYN